MEEQRLKPEFITDCLVYAVEHDEVANLMFQWADMPNEETRFEIVKRLVQLLSFLKFESDKYNVM